jgi:hypothetical protein
VAESFEPQSERFSFTRQREIDIPRPAPVSYHSILDYESLRHHIFSIYMYHAGTRWQKNIAIGKNYRAIAHSIL